MSVAVVWFTWGSVSPRPLINDEFSYALQADVFAGGHWAAPKPPIPEFFQQPHVLVDPVVASKYPPGHALVLSIGWIFGFPPLVPLVLTGLTAALLFLLAKRIENAWVAFLTWLIWISTPLVLRFQPSYLSELTSEMALLAAWWSLLHWRDSRSRLWLCALAVAIGWGAITRPLTMLALAIPIGVVVFRDVVRQRRTVDFVLAVAVVVAVLAILPVWSVNTTGSSAVTPLALYDRDYLPIDKPGFVPDMALPRRPLQPPMQQLYRNILRVHYGQASMPMPNIVLGRLRQFERAVAAGPRFPLVLFAAVGLAELTWPLAFAAVSALFLILAYVPYASADGWSLYYLEVMPVAAVIVATGMWRVVRFVARDRARERLGATLLSVVLMAMAVPEVATWRDYHARRFDTYFLQWLDRLPPRRAIVFIRYRNGRYDYSNLVLNHRDLNSTRVWVVHDMGARNVELLRIAPDRAVFEFDDTQIGHGPIGVRPDSPK